jgi:predicted MFS family arabinose efflux permease
MQVRLPLLGLGAFCVGTDAYMTAGLLPDIAQGLHSSVAAMGQLVTAFTLGYALLSPFLGSSLSRYAVKRVLVVALVVFTAANLLSALAPSAPVLLGARVLAGTGAGVFMPVAATTAAALAGPGHRARALTVVLGGLSSGTVLGVPLGLVLAHHAGWRAAMWLVTTLGAAAGIGLAGLLPQVRAAAVPGLRTRLAQLRAPGVRTVVAVTFIQTVSSLGLYTYLTVVLPAGATTPALWVWGLGGVLGSFAIGPVLDRRGRPRRISGVLLALLVASIAVLPAMGYDAALPVLLVWGAVGWAFVVPQQHRLLAADPEQGGAALALNSSATYLGAAVGAALGGAVLAAGLPAHDLPFLAAAGAAVGLGVHLATTRRPAPGALTSTPGLEPGLDPPAVHSTPTEGLDEIRRERT